MSNEYKRWKAQQDKIERLQKENDELKKRIDWLVKTYLDPSDVIDFWSQIPFNARVADQLWPSD